MFTVYADGELLYAPTLIHENYTISNPKLTLELNKAGSFEFLLPPTNVMYDNLTKMKTIITVYDDEEEIFRGRILSDEKDFYKRKNVYCEGDLAFLNDSVYRPFSYSGDFNGLFTSIIENHNSQVEEEKQFQVGEITVTDNNDYISYSSTDYLKTWNVIDTRLIDTHGGYVRTRKGDDGIYYVDYLESYDSVNEQVIEFGKNLLDITEYITAEDVITVLIPLGVWDEDSQTYLTIEDVNDGLDYIQDDTAVALFGKIWGTNTWDDVTVASNLLTKGKAYLEANIDLAVSLTVNAVDLNLIDVDTTAIRLGDSIRVLSYPHDLDKYFLCSKVKMNLQNPDETEFTLGVSINTLTEQQLKILKNQ